MKQTLRLCCPVALRQPQRQGELQQMIGLHGDHAQQLSAAAATAACRLPPVAAQAVVPAAPGAAMAAVDAAGAGDAAEFGETVAEQVSLEVCCCCACACGLGHAGGVPAGVQAFT